MSDKIDFSERQTLAEVDAQFVERWSPRAFHKAPMKPEHLAAVIEAARWSPSCYNDQPWRFYTSNDHTFDEYLNLLVEANRAWAKNASVLGFMVAKRRFRHNDKENQHALYDCGAAWMAMTLQANKLGYHTHGMAGIDYDSVYSFFGLSRDEHTVIAAFAIGLMDDRANLSDEQREKEKPNGRLPLDAIWPTMGD